MRPIAVVCLALAACGGGSAVTPPTRTSSMGPSPGDDTTTLGAASFAKIVCSAVFITHRDPEEAVRDSTHFNPGRAPVPGEFATITEADHAAIAGYDVDRAKSAVKVTLRTGEVREARYFGDQGCVIIPRGQDRVFFEPVAVRSALPDADTQPWPMGDAPSGAAWPSEIAKPALDAAVELAFDPEALTAAVVVAYKGEIVAERYAPGISKSTLLESWSMGKGLVATFVGVAAREHMIDLDGPAPIAAWQRPGDPRAKITVADLLHMSSGLRCSSPFDPGFSAASGYPDHIFAYTGAADSFAFAAGRPVEFPPNTEGRYRNCDPILLQMVVNQAVARRGEQVLTWPQRALFDRVGIRRHVLETDAYGNFLTIGNVYGTARNWVRLGMLYLQVGSWQGQRLLPEGYVRSVSAPAPAWKSPVYGGQFWLNRQGKLKAPRDAFYMSGAGGQYTVIIPSYDLVVVRMGHQRGEHAGRRRFSDALEGIVASIARPGAPK